MVDTLPNISNVRSGIERLQKLESQVSALSGGGGPPFDISMEKRVAALEVQVSTLATKESITELSGKIDILKERLAGRIDVIDERTQHMPTKFGVFAILATFFSIFGALILFQDRIQALIGLT